MKHTLSVTLTIFFLFISAQVVGLWILSQDIEVHKDEETGEVTITYKDDWERPNVQGLGAVIYIISAILIGTILLLLIIKFHKMNLWRLWFFMAAECCERLGS